MAPDAHIKWYCMTIYDNMMKWMLIPFTCILKSTFWAWKKWQELRHAITRLIIYRRVTLSSDANTCGSQDRIVPSWYNFCSTETWRKWHRSKGGRNIQKKSPVNQGSKVYEIQKHLGGVAEHWNETRRFADCGEAMHNVKSRAPFATNGTLRLYIT